MFHPYYRPHTPLGQLRGVYIRRVVIDNKSHQRYNAV